MTLQGEGIQVFHMEYIYNRCSLIHEFFFISMESWALFWALGTQRKSDTSPHFHMLVQYPTQQEIIYNLWEW